VGQQLLLSGRLAGDVVEARGDGPPTEGMQVAGSEIDRREIVEELEATVVEVGGSLGWIEAEAKWLAAWRTAAIAVRAPGSSLRPSSVPWCR